MLQPSTARKYITPLNEIANDFMDRCVTIKYVMEISIIYSYVFCRVHEMRDENNELPGNFLGELYKWALECK